jgi:hypothetical protein
MSLRVIGCERLSITHATYTSPVWVATSLHRSALIRAPWASTCPDGGKCGLARKDVEGNAHGSPSSALCIAPGGCWWHPVESAQSEYQRTNRASTTRAGVQL